MRSDPPAKCRPNPRAARVRPPRSRDALPHCLTRREDVNQPLENGATPPIALVNRSGVDGRLECVERAETDGRFGPAVHVKRAPHPREGVVQAHGWISARPPAYDAVYGRPASFWIDLYVGDLEENDKNL